MGGEGINKALFIYNFISCVLEEIQVPQDCTGAESVWAHPQTERESGFSNCGAHAKSPRKI